MIEKDLAQSSSFAILFDGFLSQECSREVGGEGRGGIAGRERPPLPVQHPAGTASAFPSSLTVGTSVFKDSFSFTER